MRVVASLLTRFRPAGPPDAFELDLERDGGLDDDVGGAALTPGGYLALPRSKVRLH